MIRCRFSYLHPACGSYARKYLINRYLQNAHPQAPGIPHLHDVRHPQERDWQRELRTTISSYMQTGAHTGPCIGPIPAFPAVFAYMGPADGPVRALAFRGGNRSQLKSGKDTCAVYTGMATKWRFMFTVGRERTSGGFWLRCVQAIRRMTRSVCTLQQCTSLA